MAKAKTASVEQIEWLRVGDEEPSVNDIVGAHAWLSTNGVPLRLRLRLLDGDNNPWELLFRWVEGQWIATHHDGDWRIALNASTEFRVLPNGEVRLRGRYAEIGGAEREREEGSFDVYATAQVVREASDA